MTQAISDNSSGLTVYQHKKRREWGLAVLAWEHRDKRGYVFENGQLRVLVQDFFSMMREVECPSDDVRALYETLRPELDAARAQVGAVTQPARRKSTSPLSFEDQIERFHAQFPDGFSDAAWVEQKRGATSSRGVGAHRDPAIAEAQEQLGAVMLDKRLTANEFAAISDSVVTLLARTDLVTSNELGVLRDLDPRGKKALSLITAQLLHGPGDRSVRLEHFATAFHAEFGKQPVWQLATALPALVAPEECVVVRPALFRTQAKRTVAGFSLAKFPVASAYRRSLAVAEFVRARLGDLDENPRDLMDVYDFMVVTLRAGSKRTK